MIPQSLQRPTIAFVDLDALAFNFHSSKQFIGDGLAYMAVVKADAYGHGAVKCAQRLEVEGVDWFGVATLEEGVELREAGIKKPILLLGGLWHGQESIAIAHDLRPVLFRADQAESLNSAASEQDKVAKAHIKVDTGMGRIGFRFDEMHEVVEHLANLKHIEIEGLMTHFAVADNLSETEFTDLQMSRFAEVVDMFQAKGIRPKYIDLANSPGAVAHPTSRSNLVRLGGILYGLGGDVLPAGIEKPELRPVMSLTSRVAMVKQIRKGENIGYGRTFTAERDSMIATIPIGYHDGYSRSLSNIAKVIINGEFAPVVGRISMDWTTVDVTDIENVKIGDTVMLIGDDGSRSIKAEDIARATETISYEVTCGIGPRVPRIYKGESS
jgi:alanine racemase